MTQSHRYAACIRWTGGQLGPTWDYASYLREYEIHIVGKPILRGSSDPLFKGDAGLHYPEDGDDF